MSETDKAALIDRAQAIGRAETELRLVQTSFADQLNSVKEEKDRLEARIEKWRPEEQVRPRIFIS